MKLIIEETEQKMSESAMFILLGAMMQDKRVNISLTSGRSPKTMYDMMIPYVKNQEKFKDIQYYLFDENPFINEEYGPNWKDMQELFFKPANIPDSHIHIMNADNWQDYDNEIRNVGGIDVMVIGLGYDGHFCGNCPRCTPFDSYTYQIDFKEKQAGGKVEKQSLAAAILEGLGGKDNIVDVTNCATRLRVNVKDEKLVQSDSYFKSIGTHGLKATKTNIQVIVGLKVPSVREDFEALL